MDAKNYSEPRYSGVRGWIAKRKYDKHCAGCGQFFTAAVPFATYHNDECKLKAWRRSHPGYWKTYEVKRKIRMKRLKRNERRRLSNTE